MQQLINRKLGNHEPLFKSEFRQVEPRCGHIHVVAREVVTKRSGMEDSVSFRSGMTLFSTLGAY